jgi:regulator of sirC expression with transglutaminase-like and TPR domain
METALKDYLGIVAQSEENWDLFELSLQICRVVNPQLDIDISRKILLEITSLVKSELRPESNTYDVINTLNAVLFDSLGFGGNKDDYYNAENSYMNFVLEKRKGIPVSLSVLYQKIASGIGLKLLPVAMPGHFLLKLSMPSRELFIDPFNRGEILLEDGCQERLEQVYQEVIEFKMEFLGAVSNRDVVLRMLVNLKRIYRQQDQAKLLLKILERRVPLLLDPLPEILERGLLQLSLENYNHALRDLEHFVSETPDVRMKKLVEERLGAIRRMASGN